MKSPEELHAEIQERNDARAEGLLPLLDFHTEMEKLQKREEEKAFEDYIKDNPCLVAEIESETLKEFRERKKDPNWYPMGMLNGGLMFGIAINKKLRSLYIGDLKAVQNSPMTRGY